MTRRLHELSPGDRARVSGLDPQVPAARRTLLAMGMIPGTEVRIVRRAPLGDPIELQVRGITFSIRSNDASAVIVERLERTPHDHAPPPTVLAIAGHPNCGKTTLFNGLTGTRQRIGNWPGVTVDKKVGRFTLADRCFEIVDLPGIYTLDRYGTDEALDERVAQDYILSGTADLILNLVDASRLEHGLYLTAQLLEIGSPTVLVLNVMADNALVTGTVDIEGLQRRLGCPVIALIAARRSEVAKLEPLLLQLGEERPSPAFATPYPEPIESALAALAPLIPSSGSSSQAAYRSLALRVLQGNPALRRGLSEVARAAIDAQQARILEQTGLEADTVIAQARYDLVASIAREVQLGGTSRAGNSVSERIDRVVLNRFLGIPVFLAVMYLLFFGTIRLGRALRPLVDQLANVLVIEVPAQLLRAAGAPSWSITVVAEGFGRGIHEVVCFLPLIGCLYFFLSALEQSGYMARGSFVVDRFIRGLGLPGNVFMPMVLAFGCNVPAVLATRALASPRDRILAVLLIPFMSCGGRLAVYTVFAAAFFPENGHLMVFGLYVLGIAFAVITAVLLKHGMLAQQSSLHLMELPAYHWPTVRNLLTDTWMRVRVFAFRVGKILVPLVMLVKLLGNIGLDGSFGERPIDQSVLGAAGQVLTPVFSPMGIRADNWPATVALLTGVLHKVVIVSTLQTLHARGEASRNKPVPGDFDLPGRVSHALQAGWMAMKSSLGVAPSPVWTNTARLSGALAATFDGTRGAIAYLILVLCYPCIPTMAAGAREVSRVWLGLMIVWTVGLGYGGAVLWYQLASFSQHPLASTLWAAGIGLCFLVLGLAAARRGTAAPPSSTGTPRGPVIPAPRKARHRAVQSQQ